MCGQVWRDGDFFVEWESRLAEGEAGESGKLDGGGDEVGIERMSALDVERRRDRDFDGDAGAAALRDGLSVDGGTGGDERRALSV